MPKFYVRCSALVDVIAAVTIEAETAKDAARIAIQRLEAGGDPEAFFQLNENGIDPLVGTIECNIVEDEQGFTLDFPMVGVAAIQSLFAARRLFNCCTAHKAPDWSQFTRLEIGGCKNADGQTIGGQNEDEADFFTIYARKPDGECEAITDCYSVSDARSTGAELAALSKLPVREMFVAKEAAHV